MINYFGLMDWLLAIALVILLLSGYLLLGIFALIKLDDWFMSHSRPSPVEQYSALGGVLIWAGWPVVLLIYGIPALFSWLNKAPE